MEEEQYYYNVGTIVERTNFSAHLIKAGTLGIIISDDDDQTTILWDGEVNKQYYSQGSKKWRVVEPETDEWEDLLEIDT